MAALGKKEIEKILEEQGRAEVKCHFCGDIYDFDAVNLRDIINNS